jgi:hypothetical protein
MNRILAASLIVGSAALGYIARDGASDNNAATSSQVYAGPQQSEPVVE